MLEMSFIPFFEARSNTFCNHEIRGFLIERIYADGTMDGQALELLLTRQSKGGEILIT